MSNPPKRIWVLNGDLEEMQGWAPGRADTVVAGPAPIHNMHGHSAAGEYIHIDEAAPKELAERIADFPNLSVRYQDNWLDAAVDLINAVERHFTQLREGKES